MEFKNKKNIFNRKINIIRKDNLFKSNILVFLLIFAAFGPYVLYGFRTEHILIYSILPFSIIVLLMNKKKHTIIYKPSLFIILFLFITLTIWALLVTFAGPKNYQSLFRVFAICENYVQPIAIFLIFGAFINFQSLKSAVTLFRKACLTVIYLLSVNSIIAVSNVNYNTYNLLKYFLPEADPIRGTVWSRASSLHRYSGIFNQPMEAGLMYSLGIFIWIYLTQNKKHKSIFDYLILSILIFGGILSVSKVFILIGIPLSIIYLFSIKKQELFVNYRSITAVTIVISITILIFNKWKGYEYFLRLFNVRNKTYSELIQLFTAGRFGGEIPSMKILFLSVWEKSPFCGLGFASTSVLDSAYAEYFIQGGLISLMVYLFILLFIGLFAVKNYNRYKEGKLLFFLWIFIIIAGLGAPIFTINHFSTVFVIFLLLIYSIIHLHRLEKLNKLF